MKISELMASLAEIQAKHGDVEVWLDDREGLEDLAQLCEPMLSYEPGHPWIARLTNGVGVKAHARHDLQDLMGRIPADHWSWSREWLTQQGYLHKMANAGITDVDEFIRTRRFPDDSA